MKDSNKQTCECGNALTSYDEQDFGECAECMNGGQELAFLGEHEDLYDESDYYNFDYDYYAI